MDVDLLRFCKDAGSFELIKLVFNSSRVFLLYCGSLPLHRGGRVGPMLTTASTLPLALLYLEMEGLNTSSNSRLRAMNLSRVS